MTGQEKELGRFVTTYESRWRAMDWDEIAKYWQSNSIPIKRIAMRSAQHSVREGLYLSIPKRL